MTNDNAGDDSGALRRQAEICRDYGAEFTAQILESCPLEAAPKLADLIRDWPGDRGHAAVALRLAAGIHALARRGVDLDLSALYSNLDGDFENVLRRILHDHDDFLCQWIASPPQTNEVGRAGAIMAACATVANRFNQPLMLYELGSSGGLNLILDRYRYELGGQHFGATESPVVLTPQWHGAPPPRSQVDIAGARGVDLEPLNLADESIVERLIAYVWADQSERIERLTNAIGLARCHPPVVSCGDAADWLEQRLSGRQPAGTTRVVFHSIVLQYINATDKQRIGESLQKAGQRATQQSPLAWISFEWDEQRQGVLLELTTWPMDEKRALAECHAHGTWIRWLI